MSDLFSKVTNDQDIFKKILGKIPGFNGYIDKQNRKAADKLLRDTVAARFEEQWKRISGVQRDLVSGKQIELLDDMEQASIKLRQFIDRIKNASYGYSSFFENVKVGGEELTAVYQFDLSLLEKVDEVSQAVDNCESSIGLDGMTAAIRNLIKISQDCVELFNRRSEIMKTGNAGTQSQ